MVRKTGSPLPDRLVTAPEPSGGGRKGDHPWGLSTPGMGLLLGSLGVLTFSFTLPLTRVASPELGGA
ncbi:MAG: hypothetical protein M3440_13715, partial [Chloroflexota bacterium]|nr:hypothetical protein [Chloroflexota bacterium]